MDSRGGKITVALVVVCVLLGGGYVVYAALGPSQTTTDASPKAGKSAADTAVMVRAVDSSSPSLNGGVFVVEDGKVQRRSKDLACERVYYADGHGLCMGVAPSGVDYTASVFDNKLEPVHSIRLTGLPSRARVSSDGRYGSMTVFVSGDAYLESSVAFSTRTYLVDMRSGETIAQLEQFEVEKDGEPFDAVDFNFWGITFDPTDSDRFYATLGTGTHHYLVEGSVGGESMRVLRDGVECPSLSPDGKRIAFKSRIEGTNRWHLHVLDVATLADHPVAEKRSIDDQAEWLDNDTLVYSDETNVYTVPADGGGKPVLLVRDATSPVALRN
jgi:hypothetical protein